MYLSLIKDIYENPTGNILISERLRAFPLRLGIRQACSLLPFFFNMIWEVLVRAVRQEKEIKDIQIRKEEVKLSLFAGDMILHRKC